MRKGMEATPQKKGIERQKQKQGRERETEPPNPIFPITYFISVPYHVSSSLAAACDCGA